VPSHQRLTVSKWAAGWPILGGGSVSPCGCVWRVGHSCAGKGFKTAEFCKPHRRRQHGAFPTFTAQCAWLSANSSPPEAPDKLMLLLQWSTLSSLGTDPPPPPPLLIFCSYWTAAGWVSRTGMLPCSVRGDSN
jgi:hypothetical protein